MIQHQGAKDTFKVDKNYVDETIDLFSVLKVARQLTSFSCL